jgi:uncharacterized membrane protein YeaQ/YmgE (transglycosylase-associated protein family)
MGIAGWMLFGLVVGIVGKFLMLGHEPGFVVTLPLGIAGALVGGSLGWALGWYGHSDPTSLVMATLGSIMVLTVYRLLSERSEDRQGRARRQEARK